MGALNSHEHDAFFSYSHADELYFRNYVSMFRDEVLEVFKGLLGQHQLSSKMDFVDLFIDHKGLEVNGELNQALREHVMKAQFLFMFVGDGYLSSTYCASELEWFRERFNFNRERSLDHTFIFFLSKRARLEAQKGRLKDVQTSIFVNLYDDFDDSTPLQPGSAETKGRNPRFDTIVRKIVKRMGEAVKVQAALAPPPVPDRLPEQRTVVLGAVTLTLEKARDTLARAIGEKFGAVPKVVEWADLIGSRSAATAKLEGCQVFVQMYDDNEVWWQRNDPDGGHLALQGHFAAAVPHLLWWKTSGGTQEGARLEKDPGHLKFLNGLKPDLTGGDPSAVVQLLDSRLFSSIRGDDEPIARVWLESATTDSEWVDQMRSFVEKVWQKKTSVELSFGEADFAELRKHPEILQNFHGVVIVDRSKQLDALDSQTQFIERQFARKPAKPVKSIFVLPPKSEATIRYWPPIVFRCAAEGLSVLDEDKLNAFLDGVLKRVTPQPDRRLPAAQPARIGVEAAGPLLHPSEDEPLEGAAP
jgi:hypothetical protein